MDEANKRTLVNEGALDGILNTELAKVALQNKICHRDENNVAGCTNEILSDLLMFHSYNEIMPIWQVRIFFYQKLLELKFLSKNFFN